MEYYPDFPEEEETGLVRLSRVRYQLADGQPDAMGWTVADVNGSEFGYISDMLADSVTGQIIFAAITSEDTGKTALIPVDGLKLDVLQMTVIIPVLEEHVRECPDFTDDIIDVMPFVEYWLRVVSG